MRSAFRQEEFPPSQTSQGGGSAVVWQDTRVNILLKNASIREVFSEIKKLVKVNIMYSNEDVKDLPVKDYDLRNATLEQVMNVALAGSDLTFEMVKDTIIIKRKGEAKRNITGKVMDVSGQPIPGVAVQVKGTARGTTTDMDGHFELPSDNRSEVKLSFSFVGMKRQELTWRGRALSIVMEEDARQIDEVVVTGYQRVDKRRSTSAISTVKAEDVLIPGMTSIDQALEGRIPELVLTTNSGEVGATPRIRVRGTTTIVGNREPLWVLDGFVMTDPVDVSPDDLNDPDYINIVGNAIAGINPQDIERIDVLKDASATALYGTQAANGVIVVTTKKGSVGKPRFSYNHSSKFSVRPRYSDRSINLMNSVERVQFGKELTDLHYKFPTKMPMVGYEGAYYKYYTGQSTWEEFQSEVALYESVNTDWFKLLTQDAYSHDHTFGLSGGTDNVRYYISLGADFEEGVTRNTSSRRYTALANLDIAFSEKVRASFSLNGNVQKRDNLNDGINAMNYAYNTSRTIPAYNADGTYYYYGVSGDKGNMFNYNILNEIENSSNELRGNTIGANLTVRYNVINGLELSVAGNYNHSATMQEQWWGERSFHAANLRNAEYGDIPPVGETGYSRLPYGGILNTTNSEQDSYTFRFQAEYRKLFGHDMQHLITAMGGYEMNGNTSHRISDERRGYLRERGMQFVTNVDLEKYPIYKQWLNENAATIGHNIDHSLSGYLTFSYSLKDYFTLNANGRFDASNKFGSNSNRRFLPIWSVSGMWNLKETFIRHESVLSDLRLRASYGTQGTQPSAEAGAVPNLVIRQNTLNTMYNEYTSNVSYPPNPNLKWELTHQFNISLDLYLFDSRFGISGDFYYKKTNNCLIPIDVSSVNGFTQAVINNGDLENKGYSIGISGTPVRTKDWRWSLYTYFSGNLNHVRSNPADVYKIEDYLNGTAIVNGKAIGTFYSYHYLGLNPNNGVPVFDDYADHKHLLEGKSLEQVVLMTMTDSGQRDPLFSGSFATTVSWKRLSLSMNFNYNLGSKVRLFALCSPIVTGNGVSAETNVRKEFLNRWMAPGDERYTDIPAIMSPSDPDYNTYSWHFSNQPTLTETSRSIPQFATNVWDMYDKSDIRVVSGSYLKCSSISLRYSLEPKWLQKTPFSNIQLSISGMNLFTISAKELKGQDPSQAGFAMPNLSVRPSYTTQVNLTF